MAFNLTCSGCGYRATSSLSIFPDGCPVCGKDAARATPADEDIDASEGSEISGPGESEEAAPGGGENPASSTPGAAGYGD